MKLGHSSVVLSPQGAGRVRAYHVSQTGQHRFQGADDVARFMEASVQTGAPAEWYAGSEAKGPLATFEGATQWVEHPYQAGVALVGDAAGATDPTFGQGLSVTVRDVRLLRDQLLAHADWEQAGHAYARERDRYFSVVNTVDNWQETLLFTPGAAADARRAQALPLLAQDSTRGLDHGLSGPDLPVNETVRRRYFGEE